MGTIVIGDADSYIQSKSENKKILFFLLTYLISVPLAWIFVTEGLSVVIGWVGGFVVFLVCFYLDIIVPEKERVKYYIFFAIYLLIAIATGYFIPFLNWFTWACGIFSVVVLIRIHTSNSNVIVINDLH